MYGTILVENKNLNEKKIKELFNDITKSDDSLLYSLVDKAYYVDDIHYKIDNNPCVDYGGF
jgi:hypothetical protein